MPAAVGPDRSNSRFIQVQWPLHPVLVARRGAKLHFVVDMTSRREKELLMSPQSNACGCAVCLGSVCTCGCQNAAARPAASCQCGEICSCGPTCNCEGCQTASARRPENR